MRIRGLFSVSGPNNISLVSIPGVILSTAFLTGLLPEFGKLTPVGAGRWVAAALAYAAALREYDGRLYPTNPALQGAAEPLHAAWRCWADDVHALLREAEPMAASGNEVPGLDELRDLAGRTRAICE